MGRYIGSIKQKRKFLIFTNGRGSEINYFRLLGKMQKIYDVVPRFVNGDPLMVVKEAIKHKREANQIWCLFDVDEFSGDKIMEAMVLARKEKINVVHSNRSFEVFLVSHFKICDGCKDQAELEKEIEDYIKKRKNVSKYEYDKADEEILTKYFLPSVQEAVTNSKTVFQRKSVDHPEKVNGFYPIWKKEWNSSTNAHELVEALGIGKKNGR